MAVQSNRSDILEHSDPVSAARYTCENVIGGTVKPAKFDYIAADTLPIAIALLNDTEDARVIAGGQSLVPMMAFRLARPSVLIDLNRVQELQGISQHSDG